MGALFERPAMLLLFFVVFLGPCVVLLVLLATWSGSKRANRRGSG
jgi:hypothetical protein